MLIDIFKEKVYFTANYGDVDELIQHEYPQLSDFECALDQYNGSKISINVDGNVDDVSLNQLFESGDQRYDSLDLLFNDLCRKGKIKAGNYLISVSW